MNPTIFGGRQKLLHLGGDRQYERDPTIESEDLIVWWMILAPLNREIENDAPAPLNTSPKLTSLDFHGTIFA
jgi:hypothetical protein